MDTPPKRHKSLPVLHVEGTFYDVGFNVGRTFSGLIKTVVDTHGSLNEIYIPSYNTEDGKLIYQETLESVRRFYPHYVKELEGMSDGANIPFFKLFLLHMDDILPNCLGQISDTNQGCSSVCLNQKDHEIIGHTEDGFVEFLNNIYVLYAHYTETDEYFAAFCYAGLLPGYAMGFNKHGLIYSINIISAKYLAKGKLPRTFVTRALLSADSYEMALDILKCRGIGIADAMSVNLTFLDQPGDRLFYNIEVSPSYPTLTNESVLNVAKMCQGDVLFHANKFLRCEIPECGLKLLASSNARHETRENYTLIDSKSVYDLLSDTSNPTCSIFRNKGRSWTLAVGFFDCIKRTWTIYLDNPKNSKPTAVFSLDLEK